MKVEKYALPFFLSFVVHLAVFAASPGDLFYRGEEGAVVQSIRLRFLGGKSGANVEIDGSDFPGGDGIRGLENRLRKKERTRAVSMRAKKEEPKAAIRDGNPAVRQDSAANPMPAQVKEEERGRAFEKAEAPSTISDVSALHRGADVEPLGEGGNSLPAERGRRESGPGSRMEEAFPTRGTDPAIGHNVEGRAKSEHGTFSPPAIDSVPDPVYPEYSRRNGEEGVVTLLVDIDEMGRGSKIEVLRSSGYQRLDRSAVSALEGARFIPAIRGGKPVPSRKKIAVRFSLKDEEK